MRDVQYNDLALVVADLRQEAIEVWRGKYAAGTRLADLFALQLRSIHTEHRELPGGAHTLQVRIIPRKAWQEERYWFKFQRVGGTYYISTP
jgi:hypothetical protein